MLAIESDKMNGNKIIKILIRKDPIKKKGNENEEKEEQKKENKMREKHQEGKKRGEKKELKKEPCHQKTKKQK